MKRSITMLSYEVSPSLVIYIVIQIIYAISSAVYFAFLCVETVLHNGKAYNAYFLFGSGTIVTVLLELIPVAVLFLSIDRCLCIRRPAMKDEKSKLVYFNCIAIIVTALVIVFADIISSVPTNATTTCSAFACLSTQLGKGVYGMVRMVLGIINVIMCIVLAVMIRRKLALPALAAKTNTVVLKTVLITLLFDFLPHFAAFILATAINKDVTQNYGPLSGLVSAVDNCLCA
uniref:G_PROTEIN_RECEP_F1_2 domain-containing protein n=1 Tax=Panagrellus redivivus TaxID=6233 RepID=A0A7E4UY77_PANRE